MKIRQGFVLREVMGNTMAVATGEASRTFQGMIKLNATAAQLWKWLQEDTTETALTERLCAEYDVDSATAAKHVGALLNTLRTEGILDE